MKDLLHTFYRYSAILMCWWIKIVVSWKWKSRPTICNPLANTVHGILQARTLEWVAFPFSRWSSQPRMEPGSPVVQVDSLPTELSGKPCMSLNQREEERKERKGRENKRIEVITQTHSFYSLFTFCCSVAQLCPTLSDPRDCSIPGFPVPHHILDVVQTHVHWVGDAISLLPLYNWEIGSELVSCSLKKQKTKNSKFCLSWHLWSRELVTQNYP